MIQKLSNNISYFKDMREKVIEQSVITIQRYWRTIASKLVKYRKARKLVNSMRKRRILARWNELCKIKAKQHKKKSIFKPQNVLEIPGNDMTRRSVTDFSGGKSIGKPVRKSVKAKSNLAPG